MTRKKIRIGIVGVGNCASSLVQGTRFYRDVCDNEPVPGLMHVELGGYRPDQDPLYQSIPFYLALDPTGPAAGATAHGVFTDLTRRLEIDVAAARADTIQVRPTGASAPTVLDEYIIAGPALADVVRRFSALTGRTPLPPRWALGFHQSRWGYSPAAAFEAIGAELRTRRLPADGLWLDIHRP